MKIPEFVWIDPWGNVLWKYDSEPTDLRHDYDDELVDAPPPNRHEEYCEGWMVLK